MSSHTGPVSSSRGTRWTWQQLLATPAALALFLTATVIGAVPAWADSGLEVSSTSRYIVDFEDQAVSGSMSLTLRNTVPDEETPEGTRYYYFDSYAVPLPAAATDVRAVSGGATLQVRPRSIDGEPGYRAFEMGFPQLLHQQSRTIELTFTLTGQPPRSEDPTRLGPTHATFPVFGPGDPGQNAVEVVAPREAVVDSTVSSFESTEGEDGGTLVHRTTEDNLGPGFSTVMSVSAGPSAEGVEITVGGVPLTLRPYPNDPEWATFVETWAGQGIPILRELLGADWPGEIDAIREDSGSRVRGFDGWYSTGEREIVLGEALDAGLLFHELAHAWLNSATIEDRWLYEGLAEYVAEQTAELTGATFTVPEQVERDDDLAVPLADWEASPGFRGTPVDRWAYPASYAVLAGLLDGLTPENLQDVLEDAVNTASPWDVDGQRKLSGGLLTTRTFLDILDHHGTPAALDGSGAELYRSWVLGPDEAPLLERRDDALSGYDAFVARGPWNAPLGLRRAMATWDYDLALEIGRDQADLPHIAGRLVDLADHAGVTLDPQVQADYEAADRAHDYEAAAATIATVTRAIEEYDRARRASDVDRGPVAGLGARVLRVDEAAVAARDRLDAGAYEDSMAASRAAVDGADRAGAVGAMIVAGAVLVLVVVLAVALLIRHRRRGRHRPDHLVTVLTPSPGRE